MHRPAIDQPRGLWKVDGSFRDAYVLNTTLQDWNAMIAIVRSERHHFFVDTVAEGLPEPDEIFRRAETSSVLLTTCLGQVEINCHFFSSDEIELDIDPEQIKGEVEHEAVLEFLERIARGTHKPVRITEESLPSLAHLDFEPATSRWRVYEHPPAGEA
jgi:hypothetical protein